MSSAEFPWLEGAEKRMKVLEKQLEMLEQISKLPKTNENNQEEKGEKIGSWTQPKAGRFAGNSNWSVRFKKFGLLNRTLCS